MNTKPTALVIDDEKAIRRLLRLLLEEKGYQVFESENAHHGLSEAASRRPDVILLDLGLPDLEGHEVLKHLREWSSVPVIILSVRDQADQKVKALDAGADDYLTKPFDSAELLARLRAVQRRSPDHGDAPNFECGPLTIDFGSRIVRVEGREVSLTPTEYALLRALAKNAGKIVTHRHLLREVWGPNAEKQSQYLRVYVTHLRKKIESGLPKKIIKTEPGIGYRLLVG